MQDHLETLKQFRQALYQSFPYRRDSLLELLDAISSNDRAQSPVELSLNPLFRRQYSALYQAIGAAYSESEFPVCSLEAYQQGGMILESIPLPRQRPYQVFGIDETPNERLYAPYLSDRQTVHRSTPVPGQVPISVGHNYSILAALPEAEARDWPRWAVPVSVERVSSLSNAIEVAHAQIAQLMSYSRTEKLARCVLAVDSRYPTPAFLHGMQSYANLVVIARVRSNRVFYHQPDSSQDKTRPHWYGKCFRLRDETTWPPPSEQDTLTLPNGKGQPKTFRLQRWPNLLMRGTRLFPMHQHPFDLLQVQRLDASGSPRGNPLWLLLWGEQRRALSLADGQQSYHQRFNLEHFLGFAKPHLLLTASQTSYTHREINWVRLACLAYVQLWIARHLVDSLPLPWQRYCSPPHSRQFTPRRVQRGFSQLIRQIGSIATPAKTRGISPGRPKGTRLSPRAPCPMVKFHPPRKRCRCKSSQGAA